MIHVFKGCKQEDMPPHIYASGQIAYRDMLNSRRDQSLIMMGRSGSGKSVCAKHILSYLTLAAGSVNNVLTGKGNNSQGYGHWHKYILYYSVMNLQLILYLFLTYVLKSTTMDFIFNLSYYWY